MGYQAEYRSVTESVLMREYGDAISITYKFYHRDARDSFVLSPNCLRARTICSRVCRTFPKESERERDELPGPHNSLPSYPTRKWSEVSHRLGLKKVKKRITNSGNNMSQKIILLITYLFKLSYTFQILQNRRRMFWHYVLI